MFFWPKNPKQYKEINIKNNIRLSPGKLNHWLPGRNYFNLERQVTIDKRISDLKI